MTATNATPALKRRIQSIDIVRGVIMLIMALDHTRDFFHYLGINSDPTNLTNTTPILFFTRWITHFCAPNFIFLSGISAYLAGMKRSKIELSGFLIKRGLWLILIEVVVLTFAFTLNPFYNVIILQVLWAIGLSMVILGLLVRLPVKVIAIIGAVIFFSHDLLDYAHLPKTGIGYALDSLFFTARGSVIPLGHTHVIFDLYAVIPWTGVMMLGYAFGMLYARGYEENKRRRVLLQTGVATLVLFIVLRLINLYGDPAPWSVQKNAVFTVLSFLNVSKYPPSLLYLLMTIGTALIALALTEKVHSKVAAVFIVYGNVPFFYYVLHFYLLRLINIILFFASGFNTSQIVSRNGGLLSVFDPPGFGFSLGVVYLVWLTVIVALYLPCRWFSNYKRSHFQWWLSYL